ncbi:MULTISPECIES: hypothetical protein [unclassified Devosia]|uniref:hypothetical protein n=1 Tax=unclassified Devosia TaxID=196773 RepID=UPI0008684D33|nr:MULTISPECIES: hypothetical protein [unclassified Devosia]MBN9360842.1 hypothetical protein [Devosia sp.]ODS88178.1 MAG: hypothetical protein ABS47_10515 [Devosia sp. SCN 66-27]OJX22795.1 MAG: hypothetical protein BGO83_18640 [Devosia sp. 66-14]
MRRTVSIVLIIGGLIFLAPLADADATALVKGVSVGIALVLLWGAWCLWRPRSERAAAPVTAKPEAQPATTTARPSDQFAERRAMVKSKRAFEDLKHLHGVPGLQIKQRAALILAADGISLVNPKDWGARYHTIPWAAFRGVATNDAESARHDGLMNSVRSGAVARGSTLGSAVALETAGLLLDKSPLIITFLLVPNDPVVSSAVFSTWQNEEIARRILSYRTELVASGGLRFDTAGTPTAAQPEGDLH